jgi:Tim44-like domain
MRGPLSNPRSTVRSWMARLRASLRNPATLLAAATACAVLLLVVDALARPGGGHTYSGEGSTPSGGSSSSDGWSVSSDGGDSDSALLDIFLILLQLCFTHPKIGIPLMLLFLAVLGFAAFQGTIRSKYRSWTSRSSRSEQASETREVPPALHGTLDDLRAIDPGFSTILFEDFLYLLYAEAQQARGGNRLEVLSAYLSSDAREALAQRIAGEVRGVVIGALRVVSVSGVSENDDPTVEIEFEVNYEEKMGPTATPQGYYVVERWVVTRKRGVKSRPPTPVRMLGCPSCGAPLDVVVAGRCSHCQQQVDGGTFDWVVSSVRLVRSATRGPLLTGHTPERGTGLPSVVDSRMRTNLKALMTRDPQFTWPAFLARVGLVFGEFNAAWSNRDLARMRPFLSDNLFLSQTYWVDAYKAQRLRNVNERARITKIVPARVTSDKHFDAVTVRLYAIGLDYTVSDVDGQVLGGSKQKERAYSEYWTFIRGASRSGAPVTEKACPNCGGPLKINMAGHCDYCKVKVTTGEFDWVLSRIEQDDSYRG